MKIKRKRKWKKNRESKDFKCSEICLLMVVAVSIDILMIDVTKFGQDIV